MPFLKSHAKYKEPIKMVKKHIDNDAIICIIVDFYISLQANNYH